MKGAERFFEIKNKDLMGHFKKTNKKVRRRPLDQNEPLRRRAISSKSEPSAHSSPPWQVSIKKCPADRNNNFVVRFNLSGFILQDQNPRASNLVYDRIGKESIDDLLDKLTKFKNHHSEKSDKRDWLVMCTLFLSFLCLMCCFVAC